MSTRSEFDHALGNVAMEYGLKRHEVAEAKQHVVYGEQLAELEAMAHPEKPHLRLACHLVFQACGHRPLARQPAQQGAA